VFAFTTIQTVRWRGFGFDRGPGFFEIRIGIVGLAFVSGDLWVRHRALLARCDALEAANEELRR